MSLSGQLSDLSLAELIEFFCNQHKTGRLKIAYTKGPGYFYFQNGALVDAKIGVLDGVDAVYYALTLENASFKFNTAFPPVHRSIHQPWAQVALEGLRRMDEGIESITAFPADYVSTDELDDGMDVDDINMSQSSKSKRAKAAGGFDSGDSLPMSMMVDETSDGSRNKVMIAVASAAALIVLVALIGIPAGWYSSKKKPATDTTSTSSTAPAPQQNQPTDASLPANSSTEQNTSKKDDKADKPTDKELQKLEQERKKREEEKRRQEEAKNADKQKQEQPKGPKTVQVTVTYDESGRVTSASGGDATAIRIARQKRFPAGKAGSATVSIPIN